MHSGSSPLHNRRNLDHVGFTSLEIAEPVTTSNGNLYSGGGTTTTITPGGALVTSVKVISPHLTLKQLLIVILVIVLLVVAIGVTAALVITNAKAGEQAYTVPPPTFNTSTVSGATSTTTSPSTSASLETTPSPTTPPTTTPSTTTPSTTISSTTTPSTTASSTTASSTTASSTATPSTPSTPSTTVTTTPEADISSTSTRRTTTTPYSMANSTCTSSEFICSNWDCIPYDKMCNGFPDCADGSDEGIQCSCTVDQFRCPNGQCISKSAVCNQQYDCLDKADEANCPNCKSFQCKSNNVCLWEFNKRRCDEVVDCDDYSDEMNCSRGPAYRQCKNGVEVLNKYWCDGLDDCGDNSDEQVCACKINQFSCTVPRGPGMCIPNTWLCDGVRDCENNADESSCSKCASDQFQCKDYTCVAREMRCNGQEDCKYLGGDEDGCVEVTPASQLQVTVNGTNVLICREDWQYAYSTYICASLKKRHITSWFSEPSSMDAASFARLRKNGWNMNDPISANLEFSDACPSGEIVRVLCQDRDECGVRKVEVMESYIAGGGVTPLGKWPWVVSLSYLKTLLCGAVLIGRRWALTAAHCVIDPLPGDHINNLTTAPFYFTITAGTTLTYYNGSSRTASAQGGWETSAHKPQVVRVEKIILHPEAKPMLFAGGYDWDMALLELEADVHYTDFVQPLCLPLDSYVFPPTANCYTSGWGLLSERQYTRPTQLRDSRMQLWSEHRCGMMKLPGETLVSTDSFLCAGYSFGRPTACQGDSGSPLMCLDPLTGQYTLAGILSKGSVRCGENRIQTHSILFAKVSTSVSWIRDIIDPG